VPVSDLPESNTPACGWALNVAILVKNVVSCYLLSPVICGECRNDRVCVPWLNLLLLTVDVVAFTGHLLLGMARRGYRERMLTYNFYILLVFWSGWNLCSHPLCRQHLFDLFVAPPEIHVAINVVAIVLCSTAIMAPPSTRHLVGLVTLEFLISLVLSSIEVMNLSIDSGWLAAVRLDIMLFNVSILLIGSMIILGTITVEKDIKNLAHEMGLGPSGPLKDDLERRKRAVLTALCDAVLTTNSTFTVVGSDEGADRVFRRSMLDELLTDYFRDEAESEKFLAAVRRQFPEDDSASEGPKRMRLSLRDGNGEPFDADVVVSDATTDEDGRVDKFMVGMHIRGEFRARALGLEDPKPKRPDKGRPAIPEAEKHPEARDAAAAQRLHTMYDELSQDILGSFEAVLRPERASEPHSGRQLRRATCEVFRRRALSARPEHVDLRCLSLPEPNGL